MLFVQHVASRRLCLFFADWLVPEGGAHNVAVGEVFRELFAVGGGAQVRPAFLLQVESNLGGQADDPLIVHRHNMPAQPRHALGEVRWNLGRHLDFYLPLGRLVEGRLDLFGFFGKTQNSSISG